MRREHFLTTVAMVATVSAAPLIYAATLPDDFHVACIVNMRLL